MDVTVGLWRKLSAEKLMLLNCGIGEDSWESLGLQGDPTSPSWKRSALGVHWKDWCWSWNSNTLATSCEELTHWKRPWCLEGLGAGEEGDNVGWDGWMASPTPWARVWVNSGSLWWMRRPGMLRFMRSQRVGHDWASEANWTVTALAEIWREWGLHRGRRKHQSLLIFVHPCWVTQLCLTVWGPMDCSPPSSSVHGIFQTGILEQVAISYFKGSSTPRGQTCISCTGRGFFTSAPLGKPLRFL